MSRRLLPPVVVFAVAAALLTWNLDDRYLWQDEATTAVLATRMAEHGRPLGYDGRNLVTMDRFLPSEARRLPTGDAAAAVRFFVDRGDFKEDTTWIGQPWGQFVVAAASFALLGESTTAARLPFALAGAATAALLFSMLRRRFRSPLPALSAVALLLGNTFWLLHVRQCRYYALSSLFLLVTLAAYLRWREDRRWGAVAFVAAAWSWFHQDFGSPWPVFLVLAVDALAGRPRRWRQSLLVFGSLGAAIAPFVVYYELLGRLKETEIPWAGKVTSLLQQLNEFQLALVLVPVAAGLLWLERTEDADRSGRRLVTLSLAIVGVLVLWMGTTGPFPFYRYLVPATGPSVIVAAYVIAGIARRLRGPRWLGPVVTASLSGVLLVTNAADRLVPADRALEHYRSSWLRPELRAYRAELGPNGLDPNRAAVEFLRRRLSPQDEVLCNYEDVPLMFYLDNPVRGGLGCFRVTDPGGVAPRFAVLRRSTALTHAEIYNRAMSGHRWRPHPLDAPDIAWGNNPDPRFHPTVLVPAPAPLTVYERLP